MPPLLSSRLRLLPQFFIWFGPWALFTAVVGGLSQRPLGSTVAFTAPLMLVYAFLCRSARWVCRAHPLDRTPPFRLLGAIGGAAIQASLLWVVLAGVWDVVLTSRFHLAPGREGLAGDLAVVWVAGILLYAESAAAYYLLLAVENAREVERRLLASQVSAREAELRALRAQLNPHFLFNSLNSISARAGHDPEAARRMSALLGDFLRSSLALGGREHVSLEEELALADRYLAIEQVRFGERLRVERAIEPESLSCLVPPLLIQPLIENAVKHGVADRVEGGTIRIAARRVSAEAGRGSGDTLEIEVPNPRDPEAPPRRGVGLGLDNVRQRLRTLDPLCTHLEVVEEPEIFRVVLSLPAVEETADGGGRRER